MDNWLRQSGEKRGTHGSPSPQRAVTGTRQAMPGGRRAVPGGGRAVSGGGRAVLGGGQVMPGGGRAVLGGRRAVPGGGFPQTTLYLFPMLKLLLLTMLTLTLSGCLLVSGETAALDLQDGGGNLLTTFVGAEGREVRTLDIGLPETEVLAIVIVGVESGDLELSLYTPEGGLAFAVTSRPATQVTRSGTVRTDSQGRLRYAVSARGARDGSYQIFVQP